MRPLGIATLVVAVAVAAILVARRPPRPTAWVGGQVLTMNAADDIAGGLLVEEGRISAVGTSEEITRLARTAGAPIVDLGGATLLPGFIDAHGHFPGTGLGALWADLSSPPVGDVHSISEIVERLRARAAETPAGRWIVGFGYDDTLLAERRHPTRADLDQVSTERPIWLLHVSGHLAVASSRALAAAGIDASTPDPAGGRFQRDADGEPTGVLEENALRPFEAIVFDFSFLDRLRILRGAAREYVARGVTTAQNGLARRSDLVGLGWAERLGMLPLRLVIWPRPEVMDEILQGTLDVEPFESEWFDVGAVKLVSDGSIQGYTGYLREPYHDLGGREPGYRGYPTLPAAELDRLVERYRAAGVQLAVHANGDAAIDAVLDALDRAQRRQPRSDPRTIIVHAQMATGEQLDRMRALGATPSFFVLHVYYWGDRHRDVFLGPERAARISPLRQARERGLRPSTHNDSPVVPMHPLRSVWTAVRRETSSGRTLGSSERVTPMEALRAVTIDAAWQLFLESDRGSIEVGKLADLVIVAGDPLAQPERIRDLEVVETIVGGRGEYRRDEP